MLRLWIQGHLLAIMLSSEAQAATCGLQGNGGLKAGLTMDGILARDLQLRPSSKFAYLLRPLPTRAAQLDSYAQYYRRRILRVVSVSKAAKRCPHAPVPSAASLALQTHRQVLHHLTSPDPLSMRHSLLCPSWCSDMKVGVIKKAWLIEP